MQTVDDLEISYAPEQLVDDRERLFDRLKRNQTLLIALLFAVAFCARVYRLDAAGLCEDETNKVFAVRSYEGGDFTANAEHPMLMKGLCLASLRVASAWNHQVAAEPKLLISEESALRFPNALFGALTVIPLFLLGNRLFGFEVGLVASLLWALGLNAIWFNRIGKEDTLLVFFMLCGMHLYSAAKNRPAWDVSGQKGLYALSGAAFGLMMASKYFPHYYGLNALFYHVAGYDNRNNRPLTGRMRAHHFAAMLVTFAVFNFAAFIPKTWRFTWAFVNEDLVTHHGYLLMDKLFVNEVSQTPAGNPWYFYWLFLAVKLPLPLLLAFIIGAVEIFRHRGTPGWSRGYLFLRMMLVFWLLPMSIVGAKWSRYVLALMPVVYLTAAVGVMVTGRAAWRAIRKWSQDDFLFETTKGRVLRVTTAAALVGVFVVAPAAISVSSLPYPSLYVNLLGGKHAGHYFPHDEFYDVGARESIRYIAENAPPHAIVASELPGVLHYYLERYRRTDIRSEIMSHPRFDFSASAPDFVILQRGRLYFENRENFSLIETNYPIAQESIFGGAAAAVVYATTRRSSGAESAQANKDRPGFEVSRP